MCARGVPVVVALLGGLIVSGCATTEGPATVQAQAQKLMNAVKTFNPFDTVGPEFSRLVGEGKFTEARFIFDKHYAEYFKKQYFSANSQPPSKELLALADWAYRTDYQVQAISLLSRLTQLRSASESDQWQSVGEAMTEAEVLSVRVVETPLLSLSAAARAAKADLLLQRDRLANFYASNRVDILATSFDMVFLSGTVPMYYPGEAFSADDYAKAAPFQERARVALTAAVDDSERAAIIKRLGPLLADETRKRVLEKIEIQQARARLLSDNRIDLTELGQIQELIRKYGRNTGLTDLVKIGYVDLTAESFRDRNVFDFEVEFSNDYEIEFQDAKENFLSQQRLADYDYIFVTDLSAAKIFREFKNKQDRASKKQTGTRQEPNPAYIEAQAAYDRALVDMQQQKVSNAVAGNRPCYGNAWACALGGALRGVAEGVSENTAKQKAQQLANTSQYLTKPVYEDYHYQLVDISAAKSARVDYHVIDVKAKKVYVSYFELKDQEKFTVGYNIEDRDPDRSSILRNSQTDVDVTRWEKRPVKVKLSDLFNPKNLISVKPHSFTTVEAFLKPLSTRQYVSASPTYGRGDDPRVVVKGASQKEVLSKHEQVGTIADERFDSVLIIKNPRSLGAGFYVTPDLVLTAYHVVEKSDLVEMLFYDGTRTYGKVIDHDVRLDLALVKAQMAGKPVKIHAGPIKLGETVEAIGHPKGYEFTITRGVVSALRKQSSAALKSGALVEFVQTDTPISPGNSGGPLFLKDSVVGVNDWIRLDKASQNLNFSVSYNEIREYLNRFESKK